MQVPEYLTIEDGYARACPRGVVTVTEGVARISEAIEGCREQSIRKLLLDITGLTGFPSPTIVERYWYVREWAEKARGTVAVAMVARPELIDARKFGITTARNLGFRADVFTTTAEALEWLLSNATKSQ